MSGWASAALLLSTVALANPATVERGFGPGNGFIFAFTALPTIIFVSSFFTVLYYFAARETRRCRTWPAIVFACLYGLSILLNVGTVIMTVAGGGGGRTLFEVATVAERPGPVRAGDIVVDHDIEIVNPDLVIANLTKAGELNMTLRVERRARPARLDHHGPEPRAGRDRGRRHAVGGIGGKDRGGAVAPSAARRAARGRHGLRHGHAVRAARRPRPRPDPGLADPARAA